MTRHAFAVVAVVALAFPAVAAAAPEDVALRYVREHRAQFGLDSADLDALRPPTVSAGGNVTTVRWRQAVDGIPAADSELRVNLAPDGRVLNVLGDPAHDLDANATTPAVTAGEAVRAVQAATGSFRPTVQSKVAKGATRATTYTDGTAAELALDQRRLVWRVTYRSSSTEVWDAFVDARSGKLRRRVNMVKFDTPAKVWDNYPGAVSGGSVSIVNLEQNGWLAAGAPRLSGPNVHTYSDLDDDDVAEASEEIAPPYSIDRSPFSPADSGCAADKPCTWDQNMASSWNTNRRQNAVQAFYFANKFHDHLAAPPINFTPSSGSFDAGSDPLELQTDDGANGPGGLPDAKHRNNANMFTPPDGLRPVMQMYLWQPPNVRTVNGGDDASIVFHEYTHGLSSRLITDAGGRSALNSPQAGAMGEGWSDWYAKDYLVSQFPGLDNPAVIGDVDMGTYVDVTPHSIRTQGLDCPVGASADACPGAGTAGSGGYTYGDFGKIGNGQEVHADGEIWAETLWDLRVEVGSSDAERLLTDGMRLTPAEPSFLDARNAILLADDAAGGAWHATIWSVFAKRGMGYYASTDAATSVPIEDFSLPPTDADPRGRIAGTIVDAGSGSGIGGASVAINGLAIGPDRLAATTDGAGNFAIENVPSRAFPSVLIAAPGYDSTGRQVAVSAGATTTLGESLIRNWAAAPGGATVTPGPGSDEYADQGCGPDAAIDQSQRSGWSTEAKPGGKSMVVSLPAQVNVSEFVVDPAEACGDDAGAAAARYSIETSQSSADGPWTVVASGTFTSADRHRLNTIAASAGGVRHVRVTVLSSQGGGDFFDLTEFGVHGTQVVDVQPPPPPAPTPTPTPPPPPKVSAPTFSFPKRGRTTVKFKVTCAAVCDVTAKLTVDRPTAKRLGLGKVLTAGSLTKRKVKAGKTQLTLKLKSKAKKKLLKGPKKRVYRSRLKVTARYGAGSAAVSRSARVTLKR